MQLLSIFSKPKTLALFLRPPPSIFFPLSAKWLSGRYVRESMSLPNKSIFYMFFSFAILTTHGYEQQLRIISDYSLLLYDCHFTGQPGGVLSSLVRHTNYNIKKISMHDKMKINNIFWRSQTRFKSTSLHSRCDVNVKSELKINENNNSTETANH